MITTKYNTIKIHFQKYQSILIAMNLIFLSQGYRQLLKICAIVTIMQKNQSKHIPILKSSQHKFCFLQKNGNKQVSLALFRKEMSTGLCFSSYNSPVSSIKIFLRFTLWNLQFILCSLWKYSFIRTFVCF